MGYITVFLIVAALGALLWKHLKDSKRVYPPSDPETPDDLRGKQ